MEQDLLKIERLLIQYTHMIGKEYPNSNANFVLKRISQGYKVVEFNESSSISFHVISGILLLPQFAYRVFPSFEQNENYGTIPNHHRNIEDYLDTNTTYFDYIDHVIKKGMSVYEYFKESLLHETMHICGSGGGTPLEEGINELKTRELAQKYNIEIAAYGYPKEVEIAKKMQKIIGKGIMDELTFVPIDRRKDFLSTRVSSEVAELYNSVSLEMIQQSKDYNYKITKINDPVEKAQLYETIDYTDIHRRLDDYFEKKNVL